MDSEHEPNTVLPIHHPVATRPSSATRHKNWTKAGLIFVVLAFVIPGIVPPLLYSEINHWKHSECDHITQFTADSFLAPDLTFGTLSLVEARAIDLSWNMAMGRFLVFVLTWISYRIGANAVVHIAEKDTVTYKAFASITLEANSVFAIIPVCREILHVGSKRSKFVLSTLMFSIIYLLALPTLTDVETGYVRNQIRGYQLPDGSIFMMSCFWGTEPSGHCLIDGELASPVCVDGEGYRWGFSWVWFIITHGLMFVWATLMLISWSLATSNSVLLKAGRSMGMWRAVMDLGVAMRRDLGEKLDEYSDEELGICVARCAPLQYSVHQEGESEHRTSLVPATAKVAPTSPSSSTSTTDIENLEQGRRTSQVTARHSLSDIDPTSEANGTTITAR